MEFPKILLVQFFVDANQQIGAGVDVAQGSDTNQQIGAGVDVALGWDAPQHIGYEAGGGLRLQTAGIHSERDYRRQGWAGHGGVLTWHRAGMYCNRSVGMGRPPVLDECTNFSK